MEALRNLGSKRVAWLVDASVPSRADLAAVVAIEGCCQMRCSGHPVTTVMAYVIEAVLTDSDGWAPPFARPHHLALEFQNLRRDCSPS